MYPHCKLEPQVNEHVTNFMQDNNTCTFRKTKHGHVVNDRISTNVQFGRQNCHMLLIMHNFGTKSTNE
jgi:hypothetical protein